MKVETLSSLYTGQTMITWQNCFLFADKLMWNHWWKR